ncbi:MAG: M4 family metallopeptidase [Flexilinea sp.]|nr:M4 family metallopeptidase [Flexilinea sp.]
MIIDQTINKVFLFILTVCLLLCAGTGNAVIAQTEKEAAVSAGTEFSLENQLSLEDLQALNDGKAEVFMHGDAVTFVDGTCTSDPVKNMDDAAQVVLSMIGLLGGDERTLLEPWRTLTDTNGNTYYVFRQMYAGVTVTGGAVKVITDAEGKMISLSSSLESELPDAEASVGISAGEAEAIVLAHEAEAGLSVSLIGDKTDMIILPLFLSVDDDDDAMDINRFVWVVYTDNPAADFKSSSELPYLAHYVTLYGEYLYSLETVYPGDTAGSAGFDTSYVFEFMEPADYTGYVDLSDGTEMEISVTVMRDKRTGMYYLGNIERQIVVADCYEFLFNHGQVILEYSPDNLEWDQVGLLSLYNYCRAWDYYNAIGWFGGDGKGTPIMILNDFRDVNHAQVNNAAFMGNILGWSVFSASRANDLSQCLDVIAHEFTHCVTDAVMTYNSYMNDYGAINEAVSDIQGQICEMMYGATTDETWILGDMSLSAFRSMSDPHLFSQPEYTWDLYYKPRVQTPTLVNDEGGVHTNSSLLNNVAYRLVTDGGMSLEEARAFWFAVDCTMVPGTDYAQLSELMPSVLKALGMERYTDALQRAVDATRLGVETMPDSFDADRALLTLTLPDNVNFTDGNWMMQIVSLDVKEFYARAKALIEQVMAGDYSVLPESVQESIKESQAKPTPEPEEKQGFFTAFITALGEVLKEKMEEESGTEQVQVAEETRKDPEIEEWMAWFREKFGELVFSGIGTAGQDGRTVRMVGRPGRTIPILMHMSFAENSYEPDQLVYAVYLGGHWIVLPVSEGLEGTENADNAVEQQINDITGEILDPVMKMFADGRRLEEIADNLFFNIKGGEVNDISAAGLEDLVLPEPSGPLSIFSTSESEVPARKSRPKISND